MRERCPILLTMCYGWPWQKIPRLHRQANAHAGFRFNADKSATQTEPCTHIEPVMRWNLTCTPSQPVIRAAVLALLYLPGDYFDEPIVDGDALHSSLPSSIAEGRCELCM